MVLCGEESNHEMLQDTGTAPKQKTTVVIPKYYAISNIKLPILKKEEYGYMGSMEMEHYLSTTRRGYMMERRIERFSLSTVQRSWMQEKNQWFAGQWLDGIVNWVIRATIILAYCQAVKKQEASHGKIDEWILRRIKLTPNAGASEGSYDEVKDESWDSLPDKLKKEEYLVNSDGSCGELTFFLVYKSKQLKGGILYLLESNSRLSSPMRCQVDLRRSFSRANQTWAYGVLGMSILSTWKNSVRLRHLVDSLFRRRHRITMLPKSDGIFEGMGAIGQEHAAEAQSQPSSSTPQLFLSEISRIDSLESDSTNHARQWDNCYCEVSQKMKEVGRFLKREVKRLKGIEVVSSLDFKKKVDTGCWTQVNNAEGFSTVVLNLVLASESIIKGTMEVYLKVKNLSFDEVKKEFDKLRLQTKTPHKGLKMMKMLKKRMMNQPRSLEKEENRWQEEGCIQVDKDDSEGSDEDSEQDDSVTGAKGLTSPEQTATGKGISNPFMAVMSEWLTGKETSNPFKIFNDSPLTGVNIPGSDENILKLYDLMYIIVNVAEMMDC
ncbi:hypothetical protein Tco_0232740 [Tanacetum coccineum]